MRVGPVIFPIWCPVGLVVLFDKFRQLNFHFRRAQFHGDESFLETLEILQPTRMRRIMPMRQLPPLYAPNRASPENVPALLQPIQPQCVPNQGSRQMMSQVFHLDMINLTRSPNMLTMARLLV